MLTQSKILRKKHVREITGLSDSTIWRMEKDKLFPQRILLGKRSVGWHEHQINTWLASREIINISKKDNLPCAL